MLAALTIAGGVALLLFAVRYLRKGLDRLFGPRLGPWMRRLARTPVRALLAGLGVSMLAPSSTTMSLLAVQTVQARQMTTRQTLAVMLGANIGLTLTVQLIALHLEEWAPIAILAGVLLFQFTARSETRGIGQVILSLGFLFLAIGIMKGAVTADAIEANRDLRQLLGLAERHPLLLAIMAALFTMLLQSATATIALVIGLGASGVFPLVPALAVVVGANVGLAMTTLVVGWRQIESRRLGLANLLLKGVIAVAALVVLNGFAGSLPQPDPEALGTWVAQAHTGFNLLVAAIGLPLMGVLTRWLERLVRERPELRRSLFGPKYIDDGPIGGVALALGQSLREIMHLSEIVRSMLVDIWTALREHDEALTRRISERDDQVDLLDARIKRFLTRAVQEEIDHDDADEQMRQLRYLSELETVGDVIDKNLCELVLKKIRLKAEFSDEGAAELDDFYAKVMENFDIADMAFTTRDPVLAQQLLRHKERLDRYEVELRDRHFQRLNRGLAETMETSAIHLDVLTHLRRINSSLSHVAYAILQDGEGRGRRSMYEERETGEETGAGTDADAGAGTGAGTGTGAGAGTDTGAGAGAGTGEDADTGADARL